MFISTKTKEKNMSLRAILIFNTLILLYISSFCGYFKNCYQYHFIKTLQLY